MMAAEEPYDAPQRIPFTTDDAPTTSSTRVPFTKAKNGAAPAVTSTTRIPLTKDMDHVSALASTKQSIMRTLTMKRPGHCYADRLASTLVEGDVVLFKGHQLHDRAIRCCTRSDYNHVAIVVANGGELEMLEASAAGVNCVNLEFYINSYWWSHMRKHFHWVAVRQLHRPDGRRGISRAQRAELLRYQEEMLGRKFKLSPITYMNALLNLPHKENMSTTFCSQLVHTFRRKHPTHSSSPACLLSSTRVRLRVHCVPQEDDPLDPVLKVVLNNLRRSTNANLADWKVSEKVKDADGNQKVEVHHTADRSVGLVGCFNSLSDDGPRFALLRSQMKKPKDPLKWIALDDDSRALEELGSSDHARMARHAKERVLRWPINRKHAAPQNRDSILARL